MEFAEWLRKWNDVAAMKGSGQHDIVLLAAQQHEALVEAANFTGWQKDKRDSALKAAEAFQEKYRR